LQNLLVCFPMKTNLISIGGSGFVGTRLADLTREEFNLKILDKRQSLFYPGITVIGDIRNAESLDRELAGQATVVLLAAEHHDDVTPASLYYDVNVQGTKNVLAAMDRSGVRNIIFTSSVAVYGLNKANPSEAHPADPFNHYGKSKWLAEEALREWHGGDPGTRSLTIIRPTVIFGERNRGNVYNLLRQIASGRFLMIGPGNNKKSMAYVGNVAAFIRHCIIGQRPGYRVFNYVDKPDFTMNQLVSLVGESLGKKRPPLRLPYWLGYAGGIGFDLLAAITGKKLPISSVRIKKFFSTTQFDASVACSSGFEAPYSLGQGLQRTLQFEFLDEKKDDVVYVSE
jgi:GlcNAc-P-P-Und epimerase